ncbi:MAG: RNA polymerase sporulation sigma factor SigK [Clostridia bacterium]|nr:RNA polymerase sporulation sigma factor SigK [Clostridia bacterium]MBQ4039867.1 RNA polymerase sporulation sigma factor SigK [Oscillospiraceae bacterium]MBQ9858933.1 RNA polymerase sporulation sigma factor SigK [Oscillospiraceae bacterium]
MFSIFLGLLAASPLLMLRLSDTVNSFPKPLSASDEQKYVDLFLQGDESARNKLIEHNLRLVAHIIKKYYTQSGDQDDLISIGTIGLIKGVSTYRPDKGVRLATYASRCIENEILMYFRSLKKSAGDLSLSDSIDTDKDGNALSLMDTVSSDEDLLESISAKETREQLLRYVEQTLTKREQQIIALRYGLGGIKPKTQRETAEICGISRSYVSRIEKKALTRLKQAFSRDDISF